MQFPDTEIEADIKRILEWHMPAWKRDAAMAWLKARIDSRKKLERLG